MADSQQKLDTLFFRFLVIGAIVTLLLILEGQVNHRKSFDQCAYERPIDHSELGLLWKAYSLVYPWIFRLSFTSLFLFLGTLMVYSPEMPNWKAVFVTNFTAVFFSVIHTFIITLDNVMGDVTCGKNGHPNSISGHFAFHLFYLFMCAYQFFTIVPWNQISAFWTTKSLTNTTHRKPIILFFTFLLYFILSIITLYNTWAWGFHSLRQIYYGTFIAFLSSLILIKLLLSNDYTFAPSILPYRLHILAAAQLIGLLIVYPIHGKFPFSWFELGGVFGVCWPLILMSAAHPSFQVKQPIGIAYNNSSNEPVPKKSL